MANRGVVIFGNGDDSESLAVCLKYNGSPESVYAFAKLLASYKLSQDPGGELRPVDGPSMATRFVQVACNYFGDSASHFEDIHLRPHPGKPGSIHLPTENGIFTIQSDFSIERYDYDGTRWSNEDRIAEFSKVLDHPYWTGDEPFVADLRRANDRAFLRKNNEFGDVDFHTFKEAKLPIEQDLQRALEASRRARAELAP